MGYHYLCRSTRAKHPFYLESIGLGIYSIEELCYYLKNYVYLIDDTVINLKLCEWIETELGLVRLSKVLTRILERNSGALDFCMPVFQECSYLTKTEIILFQEQFADIQIEPDAVRRKMKADYLVGFGMYVSAISEYEKILASRSPGRLGIQFYASVLDAMAAAYAKMFCFEEAAECLWDSYQTLKSRKTFEKYVRILPFFMSRNEYRSRIAEIKANPEDAQRLIRETEAIMNEGQGSAFAEKLKELPEDEQMESLKKMYVRNTTGMR